MDNLAVKEVNFEDDTLYAAQDRDTRKIYVGVRWVREGIGLTKGQMQNERRKISTDIVLKRGERNLVLPTRGDKQRVLCIELDFLPLWLAKISITPKMQKENPYTVRKLVDYQLKAKDVLANAFIHKDLIQQYPFIKQIIKTGIVTELEKASEGIKSFKDNYENRIQSLESNQKRLEQKLQVPIGYRQIKVNPSRTSIRDLVNALTHQQHLKYGEVWRQLNKIILDRYNIDLQSRLKIALDNIQKQHLLDKGKPYTKSTLQQKYNRMDIIEEEGLLQEVQDIILKMFNE